MADAQIRRTDVQEQREQWLRKIRMEWYKVIRPLGSWVPWEMVDQVKLDDREVEDFFHPAKKLGWRHVQNCKIVPDRVELLKSCLPKQAVVAELGTDKGDFAAMILNFSSPKELNIIDKTLANFRRAAFASAINEGTVRLHESNSVDALSKFSDGYFDWIYIDADHSYEGARGDLEAAQKKVKTGGFLVLNDYVFWSHRELEPYGVVQAVNEFCLANDWELLYLALHPELHNDVVLRKL